MAENSASNPNTPRLRSWLPHKRPVESLRTPAFSLVGVAALFTILFLAVDAMSEIIPTWLTKGGLTASSVFLGFAPSA